jgi:hypothetical protein
MQDGHGFSPSLSSFSIIVGKSIVSRGWLAILCLALSMVTEVDAKRKKGAFRWNPTDLYGFLMDSIGNLFGPILLGAVVLVE